jgi:hypothetical protein
MRGVFWMMLAVFFSFLVASAPATAALRRTSPIASSTVTARWWERLVKITYPSGKWEYGFEVWFGMPDSPTASYYRSVGMFSTTISKWALAGATITVLGEPGPHIR